MRLGRNSRSTVRQSRAAIDVPTDPALPRGSSERIAAFVALGRATSCRMFGSPETFDRPDWELEKDRPRESAKRNGERIHFAEEAPVGKAPLDPNKVFGREFGDVAKAFMRLEDKANPASRGKYHSLIKAFRLLHRHCNRNVAMLETSDFISLMEYLADIKSKSIKNIGCRLNIIAWNFNRAGLTIRLIDFNYKDYLKKEKPDVRISDADDRSALRSSKSLVLSEGQWRALFLTSTRIVDDRDRLLMAIVILLSVGGWRIRELLAFPLLCLFDGDPAEGGKPIPPDDWSKEHSEVWIQYRASKTGRGRAAKPIKYKPIADAAIPLVLATLRDVYRITQPSRTAARFMRDNPGRIYLPEPWRLRDPATFMPRKAVADIFVPSAPYELTPWANRTGVSLVSTDGGGGVLLGDLERALLAKQATGAEGHDMELSDYLFLIPQNYFFRKRDVRLPVVELVRYRQIKWFLLGDRNRCESLFERFLTDVERKELKIEGLTAKLTTHQFRHSVITDAADNDTGLFVIAEYMGYAKIESCVSYLHFSSKQHREKISEKFGMGALDGPALEILRSELNQSEEELLKLLLGSLARTELGYCGRNWAMVWCQRHCCCAGCPELYVRRGDVEQRAAAVRLLSKSGRELEAFVRAIGRHANLSNQVRHLRRIVQALERIIEIHDDETIPNHTLVPVVTDGKPELRA